MLSTTPLRASADTSASLASWFVTWHPRYRAALIQLSVIGLLAGALVYLENTALEAFSEAIRSLRGGAFAAHRRAPAALAALPPLAVLGVFAAVRLTRLASDAWQRTVTGRLQNRARSDLEAEVLAHLLRKDDLFFANRPPGEILNRLAGDISRVVDRRLSGTQRRQSIFLIIGNLVFFIRADWRLAIAGAVTCGMGAWWMQRMTQPVKDMDKAFLAKDDRVKSQFEDMLRAAPEVQVGNLAAKVRRRFDRVQTERREVMLKYVRLNAQLNVVIGIAYLLALASLCLVTLYFLTARSPESGAALIPVILKALPELFNNASSLVSQGLSLQLAETSAKRLLEYDTSDEARHEDASDAASSPSLPPERAHEVCFDGVTYQYPTPGGTRQGGIVGVSTRFAPGRWIAIVGGAGSGKSTLLQLLLGRLTPQQGTIRFGAHDLAAMRAAERAAVLTLMPQTVLVLDSTIYDNLFFGRPDDAPAGGARSLSAEHLALLERSGLADVCRAKALELRPDPDDAGDAGSDLGRRVLALRAAARSRLAEQGAVLVPFEDGGTDAQHWVLEGLAGVRCDRPRALDALFARGTRRTLRALAAESLGHELTALARTVLEQSRALLGLGNFALYSRLAPHPLDERVWQLRVNALNGDGRGAQAAADLVLVALTAARAEAGRTGAPGVWVAGGADAAAALAPLLAALGDASAPLDATRIHPFLSWRENLVFASIDTQNSRAGARVEQTLLELLAAEGLADAFARVGLDYAAGRGGAKLSGGQRQLVALCRALFRATPVVVLDEPTSALDPASRSRVSTLLREWKSAGRIVITVSHDPEFVREADEVRLMDSGRLAGSGTFPELEAESIAFRTTLKLK